MTVVYEWDVETLAATDTVDHEKDEVIDHNHQASYSDALREAAMPAPEGFRFGIVLVRDDDDGRAWAYVENGALPQHFADANGAEIHRVPVRFVREVTKATEGTA